jgi:hypothetical protein
MMETPEVLQRVEEYFNSNVNPHSARGKQFPIVEKMDLRRLPDEYRLIPEGLPDEFEICTR